MKNQKPLNVSSFKELANKEFKRVDPLIDHLLPGAGVFLFCGSSKVGKSWLALDIGLHVCSGEKFWNYEVLKKEVLYLCLEDGERRLQDRMYSLANDYTEKFHYCTEAAAIDSGLTKQLEEQLELYPDIGLIIIDTLAAVIAEPTAANNNAYLADYNIIRVLHEFSLEHSITILVIHHVRKMRSIDPFEDISGTNGLFASSDGAFIFRKDQYDDDTVKLHSRCRDMEERVLTIRFNHTKYQRELIRENTPVEDPFKTDTDLKKVVEFVRENGSFVGLASELCERIGAAKKPQSISGKLQNRVRKLEQMGIFFSREHTRDGSMITLKLIEQPQEQPGDDTDDCDGPYEVLDDGFIPCCDSFVGANKIVTSSQSSQDQIKERNAS